MKAYSLRLRLLLGAAVAVLAALALAWLAMVLLFDRYLDKQMEDELRTHARSLVAGLESGSGGRLVVAGSARDPRFDMPASGLYWQISGPSGQLRSRSLWDQELASARGRSGREWKASRLSGPFGQHLLQIERAIRPEGSARDVLVQLAQTVEPSRLAHRAFAGELAVFLGILWLVLALAVWAQVALGLRPLKRLRGEVVALMASASDRLRGSYPPEVQPLIAAINDLAAARESDLVRARQRAADLAHGMKTPLAALSAQSRLLRQSGCETSGMDRAIASATAAVEGELARARAAASRYSDRSRGAPARQLSERVLAVLDRTEKGMRLDYSIEIEPGLLLPMSEEDAGELLGVLLENAVTFARRQVRVSGGSASSGVRLAIEDDGPGIAEEQSLTALERGIRLDQRVGGHGLGLSIASELVDNTDGQLTLARSSLGGLAVELLWPAPAAGTARSS